MEDYFQTIPDILKIKKTELDYSSKKQPVNKICRFF